VGGGGGGEEQMHNVDYDPGPWRQTLSLPPPGIAPGSHASMDEGRERDHTSRRGGPPTLPGLYHSTIQPSQRGFFRVHVFV
jgi:hypothetical protein